MISYDGSVDDECVRMVQALDGERPYLEHVAWIPKKKAVVGKWLRIDTMQGNWRVEEIWGTKQTATAVERSQDYKNQRGVSDV